MASTQDGQPSQGQQSLEQPLLCAKYGDTKHGFSIGDKVLFDASGKVVDFVGDNVKVEFQGTMTFVTLPPAKLRRNKVGKIMQTFLQVFCGYLDVWFLRETFLTNWIGKLDDFEHVQEHIDKQEKLIWKNLQMEKWTQSPSLIQFTFGAYLRWVLSPSIYFYKKYEKVVHGVLVISMAMLFFYTLWGCANVKFDMSVQEANQNGVKAFKQVEHAPLTPLVLLLCTHMIFLIFACHQLVELHNECFDHLAFPLTYTFIVGKGFMIFRMVLAYSSTNLGVSIDYFIWQELVLTFMHGLLAAFVGNPSPNSSTGPSYDKQLAHSFLVILGIDGLKTIAMVLIWYNFRETALAFYFNRLPHTSVMIAASVLVHAVLDMMQTATSMFTMFIGRFFTELSTEREKHKCQAEVGGELSEMTKMLLGKWNTSSGHQVTFEAKRWTIGDPTKSFEEGEDFDLITKTSSILGLPSAKLKFQVPKGHKPGESLVVTELRMHHALSGYRSFNVSTLDWTNFKPLAKKKATLSGNGEARATFLQFEEAQAEGKWTKVSLK